MRLTLAIDTAGLERAMASAPGVLARELRKASDRVGKRYRGWHRARRLISGGARPQSGKVRARGRFRKAFGWKVSGLRLQDLQLRMFAKGFVAVRQERGGVIQPRRGKYIAVPMPDAKDSRGYPKKKARDYLRQGRLFPIRSRGKTFLALPQRGGKPHRLLWHLERSVRLEPRLGFGRRKEWRRFKPRAIRDWSYGVRLATGKALREGRKRSAIREALRGI